MAVEKNLGQFELFISSATVQTEPATREPLTYLLLSHRDEVFREVRMELSCPHTLADGLVCGWIERILLPAIPLDPIDPATRRTDDEEAPSIDVDVIRRR